MKVGAIHTSRPHPILGVCGTCRSFDYLWQEKRAHPRCESSGVASFFRFSTCKSWETPTRTWPLTVTLHTRFTTLVVETDKLLPALDYYFLNSASERSGGATGGDKEKYKRPSHACAGIF